MAFPRGPGPAYIGLGTAGVLHYTKDAREHRGWYYNKVLIGISPEYRLGMSITGRRKDGRAIVRWHNGRFPGRKRLALYLDADKRAKPTWRYWAGDILVRAPGCYVIGLQGGTFREDIAFRAKR